MHLTNPITKGMIFGYVFCTHTLSWEIKCDEKQLN